MRMWRMEIRLLRPEWRNGRRAWFRTMSRKGWGFKSSLWHSADRRVPPQGGIPQGVGVQVPSSAPKKMNIHELSTTARGVVSKHPPLTEEGFPVSKFLYTEPRKVEDLTRESLRYKSPITGREYSDPQVMWTENKARLEELYGKIDSAIR